MMLKTWKRILTGVNLLLAIGCVLAGLTVGRQVLQAKENLKTEVSAPPAVPQDISTPPTRPPVDHYRIISDRQLFGNPPKDLPDGKSPRTLSEKEIASLPKTSLQLSLKATVAFDDPAYSFAIIEDLKTRKQDLYKVGSKIADAEVIGIYPDKVVLKRGEKEEVLLLFDENTFSMSSSGKEKSSSADTGSKPKPSKVKPSKVSENKWVIKGEEITEAAKMAPDVLKQANITPYQPSGNIEGFKVDNIVPGSLYEQYGLKNGDVIKSVNGEPIDGLDKAISVGQKLLSGGVDSVTVEIERNGGTVTLNYDIKR
jgi:general secretion pathway protein C